MTMTEAPTGLPRDPRTGLPTIPRWPDVPGRLRWDRYRQVQDRGGELAADLATAQADHRAAVARRSDAADRDARRYADAVAARQPPPEGTPATDENARRIATAEAAVAGISQALADQAETMGKVIATEGPTKASEARRLRAKELAAANNHVRAALAGLVAVG